MPVQLRPFELEALESTSVDTYALFVAEDERPLWGLGGLLDWKLAAGISQHLQQKAFTGAPGESVLMPTYGKTPGIRILVFGVGPLAQLTPQRFAESARTAVEKLQQAKPSALAVGVPEQPALNEAARILVDALKPLANVPVYLFGPARDLEQALPELAARR